ncbi:MAG: hypothetical protein PVJ20_12560 [Desulfobacterales bacterium]|jgi:hypothetical protein
MGDIIKLENFKEFREAKRNHEIIIEAKREMELEWLIDDFFKFIGRGTDLAIPDDGEKGDFSILALAVNVFRIRSKSDVLFKALKNNIKVDFSGFQED